MGGRSGGGLSFGYHGSDVLGVRFFVCDACGTVHADIEQPAQCHRCEYQSLAAMDPGSQAAEYFAGH